MQKSHNRIWPKFSIMLNPLLVTTYIKRTPPGAAVTPLIPTTYDDKIMVLCNSFGGMGLYRAKNKILAENRAKKAKIWPK